MQHARQNRSPLASTLPSLTVEYLAALSVSVQCVGVVCPKHFLSLFLTLEYLATMSVSVQWLSMPRVRAAVRGSKRGLLASHQCCIYIVCLTYTPLNSDLDHRVDVDDAGGRQPHSTLDPAPCVAIIDLPAEIDDRQLALIQGDKNEIGHTHACRLHTRPLRSQQSI